MVKHYWNLTSNDAAIGNIVLNELIFDFKQGHSNVKNNVIIYIINIPISKFIALKTLFPEANRKLLNAYKHP